MYAIDAPCDTKEQSVVAIRSTRRLIDQLESNLRSVVPFCRISAGFTDPLTSLATTVHSRSPLCRPGAYLTAELLVPDFNAFEWLARQPEPVGVLSHAAGGRPERSHRYRTLLEPRGMAHELRGVLVVDGRCWGHLALFRRLGEPDFTLDEAQAVRWAIPGWAADLRAGLLAGATDWGNARGQGVAIIGQDGSLEASNPQARDMFRQISSPHDVPADGLPAPLAVITARLRLTEAPVTRRTLLTRPDGGWLVLTGSRVTGTDGAPRVVVGIEPAGPMLIAPLLLQHHGLTEREINVAQCVLHGMSNAEIAEQLMISRYTVQDHLKSAFAKTGVRSRRELVHAVLRGATVANPPERASAAIPIPGI